MAIVIAPALSQAASGNLGSINYSRFRSMAIARTRYYPVQPNTSDQLDKQAVITAVSQTWGTLTSAQRAMWASAARSVKFINRLQQLWIPNGYQYYLKINCQIGMLGGTYLEEPPVDRQIGMILSFTMTPLAGFALKGTVTHDTGTSIIDKFQYWRAGPFDSAGYTAQQKEYRERAILNAGSTFSDATVLHAVYYWYKVRACRLNGIVGNFVYTQGYLP